MPAHTELSAWEGPCQSPRLVMCHVRTGMPSCYIRHFCDKTSSLPIECHPNSLKYHMKWGKNLSIFGRLFNWADLQNWFSSYGNKIPWLWDKATGSHSMVVWVAHYMVLSQCFPGVLGIAKIPFPKLHCGILLFVFHGFELPWHIPYCQKMDSWWR